jgi:hypothetical protein
MTATAAETAPATPKSAPGINVNGQNRNDSRASGPAKPHRGKPTREKSQ